MKQKMISGITPSGKMTLGNYLGVVKDLIDYQNDYDLMVFIANLHAITTPQNPEELKKNTQEIAALYLAAGLDPKKTIIFRQSEVPAHTELSWILTTQTNMGELSRMTQFKDKSQNLKVASQASVPVGIFAYPILMAADILLYDSDLVPVGVDQKQHVELTRDLALRFNHKFGSVFTVPEPLLTKNKVKIMDLQDPTKKMSKSSKNPKALIYLLDSPAVITQKIAAAVTDSENLIYYDPEKKPGVSNLMVIYSLLTNIPIPEAQKQWVNKNYKDLKDDVTKALIKTLMPIQERYQAILKNNDLETILKVGASKASQRAIEKIQLIKNKVGLINFKNNI